MKNIEAERSAWGRKGKGPHGLELRVRRSAVQSKGGQRREGKQKGEGKTGE